MWKCAENHNVDKIESLAITITYINGPISRWILKTLKCVALHIIDSTDMKDQFKIICVLVLNLKQIEK
jgi:hypothetical protein